MICRGIDSNGVQCTNADLINSHIIPRGFARLIMSGQKHNFKITINNVSSTHHGVYDPQILCADCDGRLGRYDNHALDVVSRFPGERVLETYEKTENHDECTLFTMKNVNGDDFANLLLQSFRASISSHREFRKIALGPYESKARDVLFGKQPLAWLSSYQLLVNYCKYPEGDQFGLGAFYTSPTSFRLGDLNGWQFSLCGSSFKVKLDRRHYPANFCRR
jgi:hypothetical protein